MTEETEPDCRCLGTLPDELHPRGAPGCCFPADLSDPRKRFIANEIALGATAIGALKRQGIVTLGDLARVGWNAVDLVPFAEQDDATPLYQQGGGCALSEIHGVGPVRLLKIRLALRKYGLALIDEEYVNRHQNLDVYAPEDEGP